MVNAPATCRVNAALTPCYALPVKRHRGGHAFVERGAYCHPPAVILAAALEERLLGIGPRAAKCRKAALSSRSPPAGSPLSFAALSFWRVAAVRGEVALAAAIGIRMGQGAPVLG
jgi:hypothetical protein